MQSGQSNGAPTLEKLRLHARAMILARSSLVSFTMSAPAGARRARRQQQLRRPPRFPPARAATSVGAAEVAGPHLDTRDRLLITEKNRPANTFGAFLADRQSLL